MNPSPPVKEIGLGAALLLAAGAVASFHLAVAGWLAVEGLRQKLAHRPAPARS